MDLVVTAKIKIIVKESQIQQINHTLQQIKLACNDISNFVFEQKEFNKVSVNNELYYYLRDKYSLKSQMAQSCIKTVISKYTSAKSNGHGFTKIEFKKPEYDLVWNRDYSLNLEKGIFSVNTITGRLKLPFAINAMEQYFDGSWSFGTAKLVNKYGKYFLHIPMSKEIPDTDYETIKQVVGVDFGINFLATAYDSNGKTTFFSGKHVKDKRAKFAKTRKELQERKTPSSRRRLKAIGQRENRWMTDVNHCVSKALVTKYGSNTLFVVEDLAGIRNATERVRKQDRYVTVSWAFYQLRTFMEYKSKRANSTVFAANPQYTSQTCPKCGHVHPANRNKKLHIFTCKSCGYTSNDDRVAGMNLQRKGIEYISEGLYQ